MLAFPNKLGLQDLPELISFRRALLVAIGILLFRSVYITLLWDNESLRVIVDDILYPIPDALATLCLFYAARRSRVYGKKVYLAWLVIALAQLMFTLGDIIWSVLEVGLGESPFPSLADGPMLAYYPLFLTGILLLPSAIISPGERLKIVLDTGIVMISAILIFWTLLIEPTIESVMGADLLTVMLAVAYPVMDLVLLFAIIELTFRRLRAVNNGPLLFLAAGAFVMIITDSIFMVQSLQETYISAGWLDMGWLLTYILTGLAGVLQASSAPIGPVQVVQESQPRYGYISWPLYVPYLWASAAYVLLIWSKDNPLPVAFQDLAIAVGAIIGLVVVRQVLALNENKQLFLAAQKEIEERIRVQKDRERLINELESKNREMERFTYTVSHDLRSPLVTVNGFVGLLEGDLQKGDLKRVNTDLQMIQTAVTKMDNLLNDTLELSRIGRVINPPQFVLFGDIVKDALEQTAGRISSTGVLVQTAKDFPAVYVDRSRIVEVMINLIDNSVKYLGPQESPFVKIGWCRDGDDTVFYVRDNGKGIDPSEHERVFGLFYKVDKNSDGTGAGLAIVKRIIEHHGGRIWIESELGKGCTIYFTLPPADRSSDSSGG